MTGKLAIFSFWMLGIIWGSNFVFMKLAVNSITPLQIVFIRVVFGFFPVLVYGLLKKELNFSHFKHGTHFIVMSVLATVLYYFCFAKGTQLLHSGIAGAVSGSIPLFTYITAVIFLPNEKRKLIKIGGILIGLFGVILIAQPFNGSTLETSSIGVVYMVLGSLSLGVSFVYANKFISPLQIPTSALTTYQLGLALLILAVITDLDGIQAIYNDQIAFLGLVFGLGLFGTGIAYIIYYYIVEKLGAVHAASVTYIPPVVALFIGVVFVGESIQLLDYIATAMILIGVVLLNKGKNV